MGIHKEPTLESLKSLDNWWTGFAHSPLEDNGAGAQVWGTRTSTRAHTMADVNTASTYNKLHNSMAINDVKCRGGRGGEQAQI